MATWSFRPLQPVYAAIFIDAIEVKVHDGQVGNQPCYTAIGVDLNGRHHRARPCGPDRVAGRTPRSR